MCNKRKEKDRDVRKKQKIIGKKLTKERRGYTNKFKSLIKFFELVAFVGHLIFLTIIVISKFLV